MPWLSRQRPYNPIVNMYPTADGRWIALCMLQADRYWARFCEVIGRRELADDDRFATIDTRAEHHRPCIEALDAIFAEHTLAEWEQILGEQEGQWCVVQKVGDLNRDEQARAAGHELRDRVHGLGHASPQYFPARHAALCRLREFFVAVSPP